MVFVTVGHLGITTSPPRPRAETPLFCANVQTTGRSAPSGLLLKNNHPKFCAYECRFMHLFYQASARLYARRFFRCQ